MSEDKPMKLLVEIPLLIVSAGFMFVVYGTSINDQIFANNGWGFLITGVFLEVIILVLSIVTMKYLIKKV